MRYKAPLKHKTGKAYKVSGNKEVGFRLNIPIDAYYNAEQPAEYTCAVMQDGTLVYQPVRP